MPGIINPLDPIGSQVEQMAIDRQRALAAALQQQSMTPAEGQMVSGHYVAPSWTQFAAKLAQGLSGKSMNEDLDRKTVDYQTKAMQQMVGALGGAGGMGPAGVLAQGAAAGSVGPTVANAARLEAAPAAGPSPLNPAGMDPRLAAYMLMSKPEEYWKAQTAALAPTEATRMATQGGVDPRAANVAALAKANLIAPLDVKPGGTLVSPVDGKVLTAVPEANGNRFTYDALGNPTMSRTPGADQTVAAAAAAELAGKNSQTLAPEGLQEVTPDGRKVPRTISQTIGGESQGSASGPQGLDLTKLSPQQITMLAKADPEAFANGVKHFAETNGGGAPALTAGPSAPLAVGPSYGQETKANASAKDVVESYNETHKFATTSAPRNLGLLQSIAQLADKTLTGPGANKAMFINGVLNTMGIPVGQDATQNYQIMSKNLNMLVGSQRMGAAGGGSDALQSLLSASNPNVKEMNAPALKEAAHELIAYNRMMMAHDKALPNPNTVSSQAYADTETKLAPYRDPRLWQLEHADNDKERIRIMSLVPASERAQLLQKAAEARKLGILN